MQKKNILIIFFMIIRGFYSFAHEEFLKNNGIIMSIKKIPVKMEKNITENQRFLFDEFHISSNFSVLTISFFSMKNGENVSNGIYKKSINKKELPSQMKVDLDDLVKEMYDLEIEENIISISEKPAKEAKLKLVSNSDDSQNSPIIFFVGYKIRNEKYDEIKHVEFDNLYQVEFLHNTGMLSITIGSDPKAYEGEIIKKLINFLNNFMTEMYSENTYSLGSNIMVGGNVILNGDNLHVRGSNIGVEGNLD